MPETIKDPRKRLDIAIELANENKTKERGFGYWFLFFWDMLRPAKPNEEPTVDPEEQKRKNVLKTIKRIKDL